MPMILAVYDKDPETPCTDKHEAAQRYAGVDGRFYETIGGPQTEDAIAAFTTKPDDKEIATFIENGARE